MMTVPVAIIEAKLGRDWRADAWVVGENKGRAILTLPNPHFPGWMPHPQGGSGPPAQPLQPLPRDQWPLWALAVAKLAKPTHSGVGDTVEWMAINGWLAATLKAMGIPCGCAARKAQWNIVFPYNQ